MLIRGAHNEHGHDLGIVSLHVSTSELLIFRTTMAMSSLLVRSFVIRFMAFAAPLAVVPVTILLRMLAELIIDLLSTMVIVRVLPMLPTFFVRTFSSTL
mmetsp:Transcript_19216/g.57919  ORF Transcript_19216/g.57919 Transcript_19216/m.57919 type:complete len:99 (-) Transcript_19216:853-1149(-)